MPSRHAGPTRIAPQSGAAFRLRRSEVLRITDPFGEQVADLFAFKDGDAACSLSSGRSIDYASKIFLSTGDVLYSNDSRRMFTILEDRVGRHDFLLTPCSQEMFEILYHHRGHHPSCFENLHRSFAEFGITPDRIGTTFNVFMNVGVDVDGAVSVNPSGVLSGQLKASASEVAIRARTRDLPHPFGAPVDGWATVEFNLSGTGTVVNDDLVIPGFPSTVPAPPGNAPRTPTNEDLEKQLNELLPQ